MNIQTLTPEQFSDIYSTYMVSDFPQAELKPLNRMLQTMNEGISFAVGLYEENILKGYAVFICPKGHRYLLLDYFAILKENRGKGYGHLFLSGISSYLKEMFPKFDGFFIECENIEKAENETDRQIRHRRIAFYKDNGALETSLMSCLFGVEYVILFFPCTHADVSSYNTLEAVDVIYRTMFQKHHYETRIKLWQNPS